MIKSEILLRIFYLLNYMKLIKSIKEISKKDVDSAGGKGSSLGELTRSGFSVPDGFVILSNAFDKFLEESGLNVEIDSILHEVKYEEIHTIENASEKIHSLILNAEIPEDIKSAINKEFENLNCKFVAVRSSATLEDSEIAAWAGQLESYLNTTKETLMENVKKCWASLFSSRAIFYRFQKNLHKEKISIAVVVQKMIDSEKSGIAFSVHPITQDKNQIVIEAGFGLGEAIVQGAITPDTYVVEKNRWLILDKKVNIQNRMLQKSLSGSNEWKELGEFGKKQVLTDKEIIELSKLITKIENHYNFPVDVEWAKYKKKFYILQSRPITTLKTSFIQIKSTDCVRMFESTGMPFLINTIALEHYKPLKVIVIFRNNLWTTYLPKKVQEETLKEGVSLFSNRKKFKKYVEEFNDYKKRSTSFFEKLTSKKKIEKDDLKKFFNFISELWLYYKKTEFFYVDEAYKKSQTDKTTAKNLKHLEKIKNSGREHLNRMIFGNFSYLAKILNKISKQFDIDIDSLFWSSKDEVLGLYDDIKIDKEKIKKRKDAYAFLILNGNMIIYEGKKAKEFISSFIFEESKNLIKGVPANPGKVRAKAKVMKYGADTFDKVSQLIKEMDVGDILVAETTSPEIMPACKKASAILTNQGGLLSHAAIVSRELNIPCIVGLGNITHLVKDGDLLEVDANNGTVKILKKND